MSEVWHVRGDFSRAFVKPQGLCHRIYLWLRGYRPFNHIWWSKPSPASEEAP